MSMLPKDLLELAKQLDSLGTEISHRSGVSRAYYAGYHACMHWLDSQPGVASTSGYSGGVHQQLINQLAQPAPEITCQATRTFSRMLSAQLNALKLQRVKADYELSENHPYKEWSANAIATVEHMIQKIAQSTTPKPSASPKLAPAALAEKKAESNINSESSYSRKNRPSLKRIK